MRWHFEAAAEIWGLAHLLLDRRRLSLKVVKSGAHLSKVDVLSLRSRYGLTQVSLGINLILLNLSHELVLGLRDETQVVVLENVVHSNLW